MIETGFLAQTPNLTITTSPEVMDTFALIEPVNRSESDSCEYLVKYVKGLPKHSKIPYPLTLQIFFTRATF